jgi:hypothetical protein
MSIVPGSDERKLKSSLSLGADCLVYDLEDGVAFNRKNIAREMVFDALEASEHRKAEKAVRINAVGSGLEFDDLNVVVCILYPTRSHILREYTSSFCRTGRTGVWHACSNLPSLLYGDI